MVIGVMGGIGSGKSEVLKYMQDKHNAVIIEADKIAHDILFNDEKVKAEVKKIFPEAFDGDEINSDKIAEIAFNDPNKLDALNELTHPPTINEIIKQISNAITKYVVVESALFLGEEVADLTDELWFIYCDKKERIRRLVETRGYSKEKAVAIIANQPNDEDYNSAADEFIDNTGSFDKTIEQVDFALSTMEC
ncbi:MAG: dephospho-CoA kinase [Eubacterium sp.]|nr:dephospho-CoA kinase [Eubacterium sp.]